MHEHICPLCDVVSNPETNSKGADTLAMFGIVLRDMVPMEKLCLLICNYHQRAMTKYYQLLIELSNEQNKERSTLTTSGDNIPLTKRDVPNKDSN